MGHPLVENAGVSNAYEIAKAGGKHGMWLLEQRKLGVRQIQSGAKSILRQIELHERWIAAPESKVHDWADRDPRYRDGLLRKWRQDIARQQDQVTIMNGVLQELENGDA